MQIWYFDCGQWLNSSIRERSLQVSREDPSLKPVQYKVLAHTSKVRNAGTDANVFVELHGRDATTSGKLRLDKWMPNHFERGKVDTFTVSCKDIGDITKMRVGHDNSGAPPPVQ